MTGETKTNGFAFFVLQKEVCRMARTGGITRGGGRTRKSGEGIIPLDSAGA